jgi:hypothetical protein
VVVKDYGIKCGRLIFIIMNKELKVYLNIISKFLEKENCPVIEFEVDAYSKNIHSNNRIYCNENFISLPIDIVKPLEVFLDTLTDLDEYIGDSEVYQYEIIIDTNERTLKVNARFTIYGYDGPFYETIDAEKACNELLKMGFEDEVTVYFNGGGDSGYVDETFTYDNKTHNTPNVVDDVCYHLLSNFGGWEINEGSSGNITFNIPEKTATLEFTWNTEEMGIEEQGVWNF